MIFHCKKLKRIGLLSLLCPLIKKSLSLSHLLIDFYRDTQEVFAIAEMYGVVGLSAYKQWHNTEEGSCDSIARRVCRRHQLFGIGIGVDVVIVVDRLLIVRCKIGWFVFRRLTLTQDRCSFYDAIYGRIRLPNAHSLHWSITKAALEPILPGGLLKQRRLQIVTIRGFDVLDLRFFIRSAFYFIRLVARRSL